MTKAPHLVGMLDGELNIAMIRVWNTAFQTAANRHRLSANLLAPAIHVPCSIPTMDKNNRIVR